jgi:hypothetical protein
MAMVAASDVARSVHAFFPSLRCRGNTLCSGGWNPAVGALADIRRGSTDRAVLHYGGESERKSGSAGIGRGGLAVRGFFVELNVKPHSTAPPVPGRLRCDGTSQHGTGSTPEFGLSKTQGLAYDGEHTMEAPLFFPLRHSTDQREDKGYALSLIPDKIQRPSRSIPLHRLSFLLSRRSGRRTAATLKKAGVRGQFI